MSDITSILQVSSRGSRLSLALYDLAITVPRATTDAMLLAKGVKDLSRALWSVGVSQKEDARIATDDARDTVADIVNQCELVYTEIEAVVPLDTLHSGTAITFGQEWEWTEVTKTKVQYLLGHLESLTLTLDVLSQALKSVKVLEWSWQQPGNPLSMEAVSMDRLQMESLIVEQQLAFIKASQLFDAYQQATSEPGLQLITQNQSSQALTLFEEHAPNPRRLRRYQQIALASSRPQKTPTETLALVRRVSSQYIDYLLERWTRLRELRKKQQPSVDENDEDSSDEAVTPLPTHPNGARGPMGPILTGVDEDEDEGTAMSPTSPVLIPEPQRPRGPMAPVNPASASRSWTANPATSFGALPVRPPGTETRSSPASPRPSFSAGTTSSRQPVQPPGSKRRIPWRLCVDNKIWDHENERVVYSNCSEQPKDVQMSRNVATQIRSTYVSEDAIKNAGWRFDRYQIDVGDGRTTKLEPLYSIRGPLTFAQIEKLVDATTERRARRQSSSRTSRPHLDHTVSSPAHLQAPNGRYSSTRGGSSTAHDRPRSARSSGSSNKDSDSEHEHRSSKSHRDSTASPRPGAGGRPKNKDRASNLGKVAAGAGIAALLGDALEGLASAV